MPAGRPLSATLCDAPVSAVTVARVAPGSELITSEPRSPIDVHPAAQRSKVARKDGERRELRQIGSRGVEGEYRHALTAVVACGEPCVLRGSR